MTTTLVCWLLLFFWNEAFWLLWGLEEFSGWKQKSLFGSWAVWCLKKSQFCFLSSCRTWRYYYFQHRSNVTYVSELCSSFQWVFRHRSTHSNIYGSDPSMICLHSHFGFVWLTPLLHMILCTKNLIIVTGMSTCRFSCLTLAVLSKNWLLCPLWFTEWHLPNWLLIILFHEHCIKDVF